jgi:hypothetical protein
MIPYSTTNPIVNGPLGLGSTTAPVMGFVLPSALSPARKQGNKEGDEGRLPSVGRNSSLTVPKRPSRAYSPPSRRKKPQHQM